MTIEQMMELYGFGEAHPVGMKMGETRTIQPGTFGVDGERIRVAIFTKGLMWEQSGITLWIPGVMNGLV